MDQHRQIRSEPLRLFTPVINNGGRADQEHRPFFSQFTFPLQHGKSLNGFAKTHVIGKAGSKPPLAEKREP